MQLKDHTLQHKLNKRTIKSRVPKIRCYRKTCCVKNRNGLANKKYCRMTNYKLLRWLVEMRSRDVGHNWTLHSWESDRATFFHSVEHVACVTFSHSVTHVARLFPKLAENENRTNTSNLRWVYLYWDNAKMRMYGHDVQSVNELFIAERNNN